ncbi:endonuclease V [Crenobacter sp. SG2303]|uniref:Endonuclease V n=1 Tax=Crenobacter oryzisoli TaxID=3056844 RepID=A0ABT7XMZ3_9NEIS|nr:endonuclease V [Crenobacter sp. SG2303]MDN0075152.1 endonuclease V [Crenobacter sp. SG2303]
MIAFLDVGYRENKVRAACVVATSWEDHVPHATFVCDVDDVLPYEPGHFYRRELPCLLAVLKRVPMPLSILVVDGYVWLSPEGRPGLGAHLYEAMGCRIPVIGIAKTAFGAAAGSALVERVYRGRSTRPLFVTSVGLERSVAAELVRRMPGDYRIPEMLQRVDRLTRSHGPCFPSA